MARYQYNHPVFQALNFFCALLMVLTAIFTFWGISKVSANDWNPCMKYDIVVVNSDINREYNWMLTILIFGIYLCLLAITLLVCSFGLLRWPSFLGTRFDRGVMFILVGALTLGLAGLFGFICGWVFVAYGLVKIIFDHPESWGNSPTLGGPSTYSGNRGQWDPSNAPPQQQNVYSNQPQSQPNRQYNSPPRQYNDNSGGAKQNPTRPNNTLGGKDQSRNIYGDDRGAGAGPGRI